MSIVNENLGSWGGLKTPRKRSHDWLEKQPTTWRCIFYIEHGDFPAFFVGFSENFCQQIRAPPCLNNLQKKKPRCVLPPWPPAAGAPAGGCSTSVAGGVGGAWQKPPSNLEILPFFTHQKKVKNVPTLVDFVGLFGRCSFFLAVTVDFNMWQKTCFTYSSPYPKNQGTRDVSIYKPISFSMFRGARPLSSPACWRWMDDSLKTVMNNSIVGPEVFRGAI